jgi:mono/diheme cytochrome c family protein
MRGDFMKESFKVLLLLSVMIATAAPALAQDAAPLQYAKQGWTEDERQAFYTTSQGSHMMPYPWFKALRRVDKDEPFGADQLRRYGYITNDRSKDGLPVGFVVDEADGVRHFGMTCAACHTAEIEYQKAGVTQRLRIDGAPATANFQLFLTELTAASRATLNEPDRFQKFARDVLGARYSTTRANALKSEFGDWIKQFGDFMDKSLPASPWGPARLDAFGMIFNRVAGKDLGIPDNIKVADAPVSYPFLWNASRQDKTQWNGGVPNGLYINALGRNTGEVFGVFADFSPKRLPSLPGGPTLIDFHNNSVKYDGLQALEEKIAALKPPPWPFDLKQDLVDQGRILFAQYCGSCHEEKRLPQGTWFTPVKAVGTDEKMFRNSLRKSDSGMLEGALSPNPPGSRLSKEELTVNILATTVLGAQLAATFPIPPKLPIDFDHGPWRAISLDLSDLIANEGAAPSLLSLANPATRDNLKAHINDRLANMFVPPAPDAPAAYESRVLHGIWATAPYLHNGSVPNLAELLLPPEKRSPSFMVGSRKYDADKVGYVTTETPYKDGTLVVGSGAQPGNSNAGHKYPADKELTDDERKALLEYLKQL